MIKLLFKLLLKSVLYILAITAGAFVLLVGIGLTTYYPNATDTVFYTLLAVAFVWLLFSDSKEAGSNKETKETKK